MEKVIKNGKVAVLYSPGYGAGWYTWNSKNTECLFCPQIVNLIIANGEDEDLDKHVVKRIDNIAKEKWKDFYTGGAEDLNIKWIGEGEQFEVCEYDGFESINVIGECKYLIA